MSSTPPFNAQTNATDVARFHTSQILGKIALITGVTLGSIGDATARAFAEGGAATIIITGRNSTKLANAVKSLSSSYPKTLFRPLQFDLNSLKSVQQAAEDILSDTTIPQLDYFIANAGFYDFTAPRDETADGIESHFAGNYLAHFLLVKLLLPKIRVAAKRNAPGETRIILVSSLANTISAIRFSDWNYEKATMDVPDEEKPSDWAGFAAVIGFPSEPKPFEGYVAYGQSKTANVLHAVHLNTLLESEGVYAFSLHPGYVASHGAREQTAKLSEEARSRLGTPKTLDQGAATTVVAAVAPELKPKNGVYLVDCKVSMESCPAYASDVVQAEKLWALSEEILGRKL